MVGRRKRVNNEPVLFRVAKKINYNTRRQEKFEEEASQKAYDELDKNFQLALILTPSRGFSDSFPLPYEILIKIFQDLVSLSDNPLRDLFQLSRVCEAWRQIVLSTPELWSRIDLTQISLTKRNLSTLDQIIDKNLTILKKITELSLSGQLSKIGDDNTSHIINRLLSAPNIKILKFKYVNFVSNCGSNFQAALAGARNIEHLTFTESNNWLVAHQRWLIDFLIENGKPLRELNLSMSLNTISTQLLRAVGSEFCPKLKVLDLSTCDMLNTHSFDATQLARSAPNLEVLRLGNVSFKRVVNPPEEYHLKQLRELSIPIGLRDPDRDDALLATLAFGSEYLSSLDIRGSCVSPHALLELPSLNLRSLHMDDICPTRHDDYHRIVRKWCKSLHNLSLIKINCDKTMQKCMETLCDTRNNLQLRELDVSGSDVESHDLKLLLERATKLSYINLNSCRSMPRGCKDVFVKFPPRRATIPSFEVLRKKLAAASST